AGIQGCGEPVRRGRSEPADEEGIMDRQPNARGEQVVRVAAGGVELEGNLVVPADARGVVLFAHGSGSSRHSSRNRFVARELQAAGLGTLLIDLLTAQE